MVRRDPTKRESVGSLNMGYNPQHPQAANSAAWGVSLTGSILNTSRTRDGSAGTGILLTESFGCLVREFLRQEDVSVKTSL